MRLSVLVSALVATACGVVLSPSSAGAAPTTQACTAAAESGQLLRNSGKLVAAKQQLAQCVKSCPTIVQNDCGQWLADVEARLASIVITARDTKGHDLSDVRVTIDESPVATRLDGLALPIDPGTRHLTFERAGSPAVEQTVTVREGEKARALTIVFPDAPSGPSSIPLATVVLSAVGLAALGTSTGFFVAASADKDTLRTGCAPRCAADDVATLDREIAVANVTLGIGIASLVAAGLVYLLRPPTSPAAPRTGSPGAPLVVRF